MKDVRTISAVCAASKLSPSPATAAERKPVAEAAIASEADIRVGLTDNLPRLWRYGLVL